MKRVMIHAYLAGNLGDDLFVVMLCRRYPNIKFHILPFLSEFKIIDFIDQSSCYHFNTDFNQIKEDFF